MTPWRCSSPGSLLSSHPLTVRQVRAISGVVAAVVLVASVVATAIADDPGGAGPTIEIRQVADRGDPQREFDDDYPLEAAVETGGLTRTTGVGLGIVLRTPERFVISGHAVPFTTWGFQLVVDVRCAEIGGKTTEARSNIGEKNDAVTPDVQTITVEVRTTRATACEVGAVALPGPRPGPRVPSPTPEAYVELWCPTTCVLVDPELRTGRVILRRTRSVRPILTRPRVLP